MKRILSLVLCFMLVFSLAVPAFADNSTNELMSVNSITSRTAHVINGPVRLRSSAVINNYNTLCQLPTGTSVVILNENCAFESNYWWSYVYVPGNASGYQYGYVATNFLSW